MVLPDEDKLMKVYIKDLVEQIEEYDSAINRYMDQQEDWESIDDLANDETFTPREILNYFYRLRKGLLQGLDMITSIKQKREEK